MKQNRITFIFISIQSNTSKAKLPSVFSENHKKKPIISEVKRREFKITKEQEKNTVENRKQQSKNKNKINTPKIVGFGNEKIIKKRISPFES